MKLVIFCDSSLGNLPNGETQGGHFIALFGCNGCFSPFTWQSKRIGVARSTLAAEMLAMADAIDNRLYLDSLYMELMSTSYKEEVRLPIVCLTYCYSLKDAILSTLSKWQRKD